MMSTHTTDSLPKRQPAASSARDTNRKASLPASGTLHQLKLSAGRAGGRAGCGTCKVLHRPYECTRGLYFNPLSIPMASVAAAAGTAGVGWHRLTHAPAEPERCCHQAQGPPPPRTQDVDTV